MYAIRLIPPGVYSPKQAKNIPNIVLNELVDTLNVKAKVPHTVIIMINDYRFWNDTNLLKYQMERLIGRFIKEIRRIVEARNNSLPPRAVNWDYPRIFITRALPMPNNMPSYPKGFKANRRRYNKLLQRGEAQHDYKSINLPEFTCENDNSLFLKDGSISNKGYKTLWIAVSDAIHKADNQMRINLNKAKAKQLAAQIQLTSKELQGDSDDDSFSDMDYLDESVSLKDTKPVTRPIKRALLAEFEANSLQNKDQTAKKRNNESPISEYFTSRASLPKHAAYNRAKTQQSHNHHKQKNFGATYKRNKNNWRNPNNHHQY